MSNRSSQPTLRVAGAQTVNKRDCRGQKEVGKVCCTCTHTTSAATLCHPAWASPSRSQSTSPSTMCSGRRPCTPHIWPSSTRSMALWLTTASPQPSRGHHALVLHQASISQLASRQPTVLHRAQHGGDGYHKVPKKWQEAGSSGLFCLRCWCPWGSLGTGQLLLEASPWRIWPWSNVASKYLGAGGPRMNLHMG